MRSVGTLGDRVLCKLVRIPRFQPASFVWTSHSPAGLGGPQGEERGVSEASGVVPAFYTSLQLQETKATPPLQERSGLPGKAAPTLLRRRLHSPPHPPHPHPPLSSMGWDGASVDLQMQSHCSCRALPGPAEFRLGLLPPLLTLKP